MIKHKSLIYFLLGIFVGAVVFVVYNSFRESFNKDNDALFVNACSDLNGEKFTYENIKHLKGYKIVHKEGKNEHVLINKEIVDKYLQYARSYDSKDINNKEMQHIELLQQSASPHDTWVCWLTYNKEDGAVSANALYTPDWASYQDTFIEYNSTLLSQD